MTSHVPIYLNIRSEFEEKDTSRYRLALTEQILIQSLKHQVSKGFTVVLSQNPEDKYCTRREKSFRSVADRVIAKADRDQMELGPRIEVTCGDDDFLGPHFFEVLRNAFRPYLGNVQMFVEHGYIFHEGKLVVWRNKEDLFPVTQFGNPDSLIVRHEGFSVSNEAQWIYTRHAMNSTIVHQELIRGVPVKLKWAGWDQNIVTRYCEAKLKTATANGCTLHPTKSKSIIFGKGSARSRRKK